MAESCVVPLIEIRDEFVLCEICLDFFNDGDKLPRILPCHHSFCCQCLTSVWKNSPEGVICPNCRQIWPVQNNIEKTFPQNKVLTDLVEYIRIKNNTGEILCQDCPERSTAIARCLTCCEYMCERCRAYHSKFSSTKHHKTVDISQLVEIPQSEFFQRKDICTNHENMKVDVYCKTCCTAVCSTCALVSHRDHEICNLKDVYSDKKEQIRSTLCKLQMSIEKSKSYIDKLTREKQTLDETKEESLMKIDEASEEVIKKIQDLTKQLKNDVVRNVDKEKSDRDEQIKVVSQLIKEKSEHLLHCQQILQFARQVEFAQMFGSLENKTKTLITSTVLVELQMKKINLRLQIFRVFENILNKSAVVYDGSRHIACFLQNRDKSEQNGETVRGVLLTQKISVTEMTSEDFAETLSENEKMSLASDDGCVKNNTEITEQEDGCFMRKFFVGQYREVFLPSVQFDKNAVNWKCCSITECDELINKHSLPPDTEETSTLKYFKGVLGNKTFHHPICYYWQVDVAGKVLSKAELDTVTAQVGVCTDQNYDDLELISYNTHAWCVSVDTCSNHNSLCLDVHSLGEEISDKPFANFEKNKEFIVNLGLLLDTKNRKFHIIRLNVNKCEYSIPDIDVSKPLVPVFGVYSPRTFDIKVKVVPAADVFQNDKLVGLISNLLKNDVTLYN